MVMDSSYTYSSGQMLPAPEAFRLRWDVFLSFRGPDTRAFTDFLKDSLESLRFGVFRDDEGLDRGDEIAPSLLEAIDDSSAFIVILSPRYASSDWCLDELAEICDRCRLILPVFYRVRPSDVREQKGPFEEAFRTHEAVGVQNAPLERWRNAMAKVGGIAGYVFEDAGEANEVRNLVQRISKELRNVPAGAARYTVGLDDRVEEVIKLLQVQPNGVRVLGLHGMGGVGKTTLARTLFESLVGHFGLRSFIANVREASSKNDGSVSLQNRIISDLSPGAVVPIIDFKVGISAIKRILQEKRVLLVLDDVDDVNQLDYLIGNREWLYKGSLVVITTRNERVLPESYVNVHYEVKELESSQAVELFSYHALRRKEPGRKFFVLSRQIVSLIGTLPLALEVFGSFLFSKRRVEEWADALGKLRQIRPCHLLDVMKLCFNGLDEEEKCILINVANLFLQMGLKRDDVIKILRCYGFSGETAMTTLREKCFIKITEDNMMFMHDEIRDMGRQIVLADPGMLSRLWDRAEILAVLKGEKDMAWRTDFVDEINPHKIDWKIKVRIIRMWREPDYMNLEKTRSIEMVLKDERGGRIHCTIKGTLISSFQSLLNEGAAYQMTYFEVNHNNQRYRTTRHKFKLNFMQQTNVVPESARDSKNGFLFMTFPEICLLKDDTFLVDVQGKVVEKGNVIEKESKGKKTKRLEIQLEDPEKNKLKCTLWDKYADEMHSFLAKEKAGSLMVIIQFGRVKLHNGGLEISNEYFGTKLLLVYSIVTVATVHRNRILHGKDSYYRSSQITSWNVKNKKTIDEILKTLQPMSCVTLAKITEIETRYSWWYIACESCRTKVKQRGSKFFCNKCDRFVMCANLRFKVPVKVNDGTGTTSFIIFDPEASQILGKTATEMRQRIIRDGVLEDMHPAELYELLDKKFLFKVKIKENQRTFSVLRMTDDDNLKERFLTTAAKQGSISNDIEDTLPNKTTSKRLYSEALVQDTMDEGSLVEDPTEQQQDENHNDRQGLRISKT